jgi:hypothetical protein
MEELFEIIDEVLAAHPEYEPAIVLIMEKLAERQYAEVMFLRSIVGVRPGSTRTQ